MDRTIVSVGVRRLLWSCYSNYLAALTKQPFLRYIIIQNPEGTFFAVAASALADLLSSTDNDPEK